jgi:hypothetical protein
MARAAAVFLSDPLLPALTPAGLRAAGGPLMAEMAAAAGTLPALRGTP